jgi:outer membrane receptor protein involved in Fe transport
MEKRHTLQLRGAVIATCILISGGGFSQTGKISGRVLDGKTGETLPGAAVIVQGTSIGTATDLDGKYTLPEITAGIYTLEIRFVSYATKLIPGIKVNAGETNVVDVSMEPVSSSLQEVVIEASLSRESQGVMLLMQKNNASLSDGISAEVIRKTPDKNTGEVLKRVSGASIQDNKFAIIRGLSDRYNIAMVNGTVLPSTEAERRTFSFDLFPSVLVDNISINKTATPDMPGEFAGGLIQITTRDVPEKNFYSFSAGSGYNTVSTWKEYYSYTGGKKDWMGLDDGTRALPAGFPVTEDFTKLKKTEKAEFSNLFANDWGVRSGSSSPLSKSLQFAMGHRATVFKNEFGSIFALTYNSGRRYDEINRRDFNEDTTMIYDYQDARYKYNVQWGGLLNLSYKIGSNHRIRIQNLYNVTSEDQVIARNGINHELDQYVRSTAMQFTSARLYVSQISGDHLFGKSGIRIAWNGGYTDIMRSIPNLRKMYYTKNVIPNDESDTIYTAYIQGVASPNYGGRFYSKLEEKIYSGGTNVTLPVKLLNDKSTLKIGAFQQHKHRDFGARVLGMVINDFFKFNWDLLKLPADSIFAPENIGVNGFRVDEITNKSDRYDAQSTLNAGYLMFDNHLFKKLRFIWGARVEVYNQQLHSYDYGNKEINTDTIFRDVLPSANIVYSFTGKMNLRAAVSRTLSRPEFREMAPFSFYDFNTSTAMIGNPKLERGLITNYDLRYEIYPGSGQLFAFTVFYKAFINPIEQVLAFGGAGTRTVTFANVNKATNYGTELEFRKNLSVLGKITKCSQLENVTVFANAAFIRSVVDVSEIASADSSERPLQGQSPYIINAGIQYSNPKQGINFTILYNRIGRRIAEVGAVGYLDVYEDSRPLLDFQVSKRFLKNGDVKLNISDFLHRDVVYYQDQNKNGQYDKDADTRITNIITGINYSLSLSYKF